MLKLRKLKESSVETFVLNIQCASINWNSLCC